MRGRVAAPDGDTLIYQSAFGLKRGLRKYQAAVARTCLSYYRCPDRFVDWINSHIATAGKHYHSAKRRKQIAEIICVIAPSGIFYAPVGTPRPDAAVIKKPLASIGNKYVPGISAC